MKLHLSLQSSAPSKLSRSGTETRGSELAVVVRTRTEFSEHGPDLSDVLDWNRVKTLDNTVSLLLPTNEKLYLFIYRFQENHTSFELEQWLLGQSPLLNPIDFGKSEVFSVSNTESTLIINGERSSILSIQLARQLSGRLAQNYVMGANVWADRIEPDGSINQKLDEDENFTISGPVGEYDLAPDYLDYVLTTVGGVRLGASGVYIPAAPMLATLPEDRQIEVHITPLTTLVTADPALESIFAQSGDWRADIASPQGIPGALLKLAKVTEAYWMLLVGGSNPIIQSTQQQFSALSILANKLAQGGERSISEDLPSLVGQAVDETLSNPEISRILTEESKLALNLQLTGLTAGLVELLPNNDQVVEEALLSEFDELNQQAFNAVQNILCEFSDGVSVQFDPIILSISLVPTSENTIAVRGTVSDDDIASLSTYWAINPPQELQESIKPVLINATVNQSGYVETILNVDNWDYFGSVSLQLTACNPINVISESCNWVPNSAQVNCNFME
ncbi:MAG: hypothetical protein P8O70_07005 [SAR324 cluster bacterium]|nr:hypothetical protein [SAR324 cluster bacterium]